MTRDSREWLETDGLGGFAMGTADGIRTRRYHATLLAATRPPEGRMVLVAELEVYAETPAGKFGLSSADYNNGYLHPDGAKRITSFKYRPWPTWEHTLPDGTKIKTELVVERGRPATCLRWTKLAGGPCTLIVRPMLAVRDYHSTHHHNTSFKFDHDSYGDTISWSPYGDIAKISALTNGSYRHSPEWYKDFYYAEEAKRGLEAKEDLASPGEFTFDLARPAHVLFELGTRTGKADVIVTDAFLAEGKRRSGDAMAIAADQYIVQRGAGQTVIAGFPWFSDWGRDTFISLRGLCLATGKRETAGKILREWAGVVSEGMLPNRFDEGSAKPEFNSVDAALWYVIAADAYISTGCEAHEKKTLETAIDAIVAGYHKGTRHRIGCDLDGLLNAGVHGVQLTWMDAKLGDWVVTPRIGKPVEINALWINALAIAGKRTPRWRQLAEEARASFVSRFWDTANGRLFDVIDCDHVAGATDSSDRPNQIFAVGGLPIAILDGERAKALVDHCFKTLWTPAGPRSLAESDTRYCPTYGGGPADRDRVYHNGPVWPWLAGAFVEAWVRVHGDKAAARSRYLEPLMARLEIAGLGHMAEICEGGSPHTPVGCPFQAWSLAEVIRLDRVVLR